MSFLDLENQRPGSVPPGAAPSDTPSAGPGPLIAEFATQVKRLERERRRLTANGGSDAGLMETVRAHLIPQCHATRDKIVRLHLLPEGRFAGDFHTVNAKLETLESQFKEIFRAADAAASVAATSAAASAVGSPGRASSAANSANYVSIHIDEHSSLLNKDQGGATAQMQTQLPQQSYGSATANALDQEELDFHTIIEQDREAQISRIHGAVSEVNAIFHQLGSLIQEQGAQVETIDDNIQEFAGNTQRANEQLKKADENQRKRNKCGLVTLVVVSVVLLTIILVALS